MSSSRPVRIALASFGRSGRVFHAPFLVDNPRFDVVAVLERRTERSRTVFPEVEIVRTFTELLRRPDIEVIVVNTPDSLHYEMSVAALRAGKHVVVEKPMVPTRGEAEALVRIAAANRRSITTYFNRRYDADFQLVRSLIRDGALGEVLEFESRYDMWREVEAAAWRERSGATAGALYNIGSHLVDQAIALFGAPESVLLDHKRVRPGSAIYDSMYLRPGYRDYSVTLQSSYAAREPFPRFRVRGTAATLVTFGVAGSVLEEDDTGPVGHLYRRDSTMTNPETIDISATDYGRFYEDLYATIRDRVPHPISPLDAVRNVALLEAAERSFATGRRIACDADTGVDPGV